MAGNNLSMRNRTKEAREMLLQCRDIWERKLPPDHKFLAINYNYMANTYSSDNLWDESMELYQKAVNIRLALPEAEWIKLVHAQYLNMAGIYVRTDRLDEAWKYTMLGRENAKKAFGEGTLFDAMYATHLPPHLPLVNELC